MATFMSPDEFLTHWQGHRRLTRKIIEKFPEDQLFTFSIGGMRPFGDLVNELLSMASTTCEGVLTRTWPDWKLAKATTKAELLERWDADTAKIDEMFPKIPEARFAEHDVAFGMFPGLIHHLLLYIVDNEIHHRGQGYVYLRALGIEPVQFYERA